MSAVKTPLLEKAAHQLLSDAKFKELKGCAIFASLVAWFPAIPMNGVLVCLLGMLSQSGGALVAWCLAYSWQQWCVHTQCMIMMISRSCPHICSEGIGQQPLLQLQHVGGVCCEVPWARLSHAQPCRRLIADD